jgi:uncharacterized Tic20 family protein
VVDETLPSSAQLKVILTLTYPFIIHHSSKAISNRAAKFAKEAVNWSLAHARRCLLTVSAGVCVCVCVSTPVVVIVVNVISIAIYNIYLFYILTLSFLFLPLGGPRVSVNTPLENLALCNAARNRGS